MSTSHALDALQLPLRGRQVIEASAGTGKTWTLAALYLRLVLGHGRGGAGLLPPEILVMTFTEAATAELRERIRHRLSTAAQCFDAHARGQAVPPGVTEDDYLRRLRESLPPTDWPRCAMQLHAAADWMDEAAIYTIHGWSRRMLAQHALTSGHLFEQTHLENRDQLLRQLVQDYWRQWFYPLNTALLRALSPVIGATPDDWLHRLRDRWQQHERRPQVWAEPSQTPAQVVTEWQAWDARCQASAAQARAAWHDGVLADLQATPIPRAQARYYGNWLEQLQQWASDATTAPDLKLLARFGRSKLAAAGWAKAEAHAFFGWLDDHLQDLQAQPDLETPLIDHAAFHVGEAFRHAKAQRAAFDFADLLQQLHNALVHDTGTLAQTIRRQYPVALVDEFQDTDPWQYGSLDRIYAVDAVDAQHALVMIGDPKQAIYGFRGADLQTYLAARQQALALDPAAVHTLDTNHRSSAALVRALTHVFTREAHPFSLNPQATQHIDFVSVQARADVADWTAGPDAAALTVWHLPTGDKPWNKPAHLHRLANVFADHMARLLNQSLAVPGDMAVLVRNQDEADAMRDALRARHIPSVYLSDRSTVFATPEAVDLWRVLRALAAPRALAPVRAAVASGLWGLSLPALEQCLGDEAEWEALLARCHDWHQRWQQHGVLPMLHHWLHHEQVAARLLAAPDGERRLSNLLHLGELLQHAATGLQGPHALLRWLAEQIQQPPTQADAQKMRLETDAQCVQVITYHKSKGLEYPLVFMPFGGSFAYESAPEDDEVASTVEEDLRLIYVALTRAKRAVWLGLAETTRDLHSDGSKRSAFSHLLQRQTRGDLAAQLNTLWGDCADIRIAPAPEPTGEVYRASSEGQTAQAALTPQRSHPRLWWTASFSALTRGLIASSSDDESFADALTDADADTDGRDEAPAHDAPWQSFPAGARYGTLLHDLLEWQSQHGWPLVNDPTAHAADWQHLLRQKTQWLQLPPASVAQLEPWLKKILRTPLPLSDAPALALHTLAPSQLWAEMAFHLEVQRLPATHIDRWVQQHLFAGQTRPALQARQLQGMLTGFLDLVFEHDGRYWVVDYKSNRLDRYDAPALQAAVLHKRYEVQYTLYLLALHRLLQARLPDYDYDRHIGGAVYCFLRGIESPGAGVHLQRPPRALIEQLDAACREGV